MQYENMAWCILMNDIVNFMNGLLLSIAMLWRTCREGNHPFKFKCLFWSLPIEQFPKQENIATPIVIIQKSKFFFVFFQNKTQNIKNCRWQQSKGNWTPPHYIELRNICIWFEMLRFILCIFIVLTVTFET